MMGRRGRVGSIPSLVTRCFLESKFHQQCPKQLFDWYLNIIGTFERRRAFSTNCRGAPSSTSSSLTSWRVPCGATNVTTRHLRGFNCRFPTIGSHLIRRNRFSPFATQPPTIKEGNDDSVVVVNPKRRNNNIESHVTKITTTSDPPIQTWWFRNLPSHIHPYIRLARLDKPIGTWLLLWPCCWSTALAAPMGGWPDISLLAMFGLGALVMRGAGCTINDMWDQDFDRHVARTQSRPLVSGELSNHQALKFLALQLSAGCVVLVNLPHTWYCFQWGVASLPLVVTYPLLKRYTNLPQLGLGMVFNWGAWMGWAATFGSMNWWVVVPLYLSGISWTLCYDTLYAHQDKEDDAKLGLKSTALYFGQHTKPILHVLALCTFGNWYTVGCSEAFHIMSPHHAATSMDTTTSAVTEMINDIDNTNLLWGSTSTTTLSEYFSPLDTALMHYVAIPDPWYLLGTTAAYGHLVWQIQTARLDQPSNLATRFRSNTTVGALVFASLVAAKLHT